MTADSTTDDQKACRLTLNAAPIRVGAVHIALPVRFAARRSPRRKLHQGLMLARAGHGDCSGQKPFQRVLARYSPYSTRLCRLWGEAGTTPSGWHLPRVR